MIAATRLALRLELRRARRDRDNERIGLLEEVLKDDDLLALVHSAAVAEYEYANGALGFSQGAFGDAFQNLFKFIMDHREEILAFIKILITILAVL